ncbi:MAG TPA: Cys-tRNA(Pro) deacylase [Lachnospiraceae bacterium]|nr:Cys-tRNA(Pro) deacylase [Lachnospiraceae bacterium]
MAKETKTNAMRMLDRAKISYEVIHYDCEEFIDGVRVAEKTGAPVEQSFKTLVMQGKSSRYYVIVLPVAAEVDLKKAARVVGEKSLEMLHVKDIQKVTGYIRGGCSPLGMKKQFPTVIHDSARNYRQIYISGGRIGTTIVVAAQALADLTGADFADVTAGG